jgi:hypothetical protein
VSHDVFVSYARGSRDLVVPICDALERRGAHVWMDASRLGTVTPWRPEVIAAIRAARVVLIALTPAWVTSPACRQELTIARAEHKPLVAVVLEHAKPPFDVEVVDVDAVCERLALR